MAAAFVPKGSESDHYTVEEVAGRRYRVFRAAGAESQALPPRTDGEAAFDDSVDVEDVVYDDAKKDYKLVLPVAQVFFPFLIGGGGSTRKKLQEETGCQLLIPGRGDDRAEVVLRGPSETAVLSLRTRVLLEMDTAMNKLPPTHFVCLPLNAEPWRSKAERLQADIGAGSAPAGFDPSIVMPPARMHITLLMLKLYTASAQRAAVRCFEAAAAAAYDAVDTRTVEVHLRGLSTMDRNLAASNVLYARVDGKDQCARIEKLARTLLAQFTAARLPVQLGSGSGEDLKLHATILNTKYRTDVAEAAAAAPAAPTAVAAAGTAKPPATTTGAKGAARPPRIPFDAREILSQYGQVDLGRGRVAAVALCQMSRQSSNSSVPSTVTDGFYATLATVPLP